MTFLASYITCSMLTGVGAILLMAQIGQRSAAARHTLASITAVVLGGTSLAGGQGPFIETLLGAVLLTEVLNAVTFLGLSQTYQYLFQGLLLVACADSRFGRQEVE